MTEPTTAERLAVFQVALLGDLAEAQNEIHRAYEPAILGEGNELVPSPSRIAMVRERIACLHMLSESGRAVGDMLQTIAALRERAGS